MKEIELQASRRAGMCTCIPGDCPCIGLLVIQRSDVHRKAELGISCLVQFPAQDRILHDWGPHSFGWLVCFIVTFKKTKTFHMGKRKFGNLKSFCGIEYLCRDHQYHINQFTLIAQPELQKWRCKTHLPVNNQTVENSAQTRCWRPKDMKVGHEWRLHAEWI